MDVRRCRVASGRRRSAMAGRKLKRLFSFGRLDRDGRASGPVVVQKLVINAGRAAGVRSAHGRRWRIREAGRRAYGRRAFLGVSAVGLSSLVWGRPAWHALSGVTTPAHERAARGDRALGRLAHLHRCLEHAALRPGDLEAERSTASSAKPQSYDIDALRSLPRAEQVSTFHCVTGWSVRTSTGPASGFGDLLAAGASRSRRRACSSFVSAERPYVDTLTRRAGRPCRRDARIRDGRQAAGRGARRAGAGRYPRDVRLQERQMGRADRAPSRRASPGTGSSAATTPTPGLVGSNGL